MVALCVESKTIGKSGGFYLFILITGNVDKTLMTF